MNWSESELRIYNLALKNVENNNKQLARIYLTVQKDIADYPNEPVPIHLRNAPTKLMKNLGYGKNYKYTPKFENPEDAEQEYLPKKLKGRKYID